MRFVCFAFFFSSIFVYHFQKFHSNFAINISASFKDSLIYVLMSYNCLVHSVMTSSFSAAAPKFLSESIIMKSWFLFFIKTCSAVNSHGIMNWVCAPGSTKEKASMMIMALAYFSSILHSILPIHFWSSPVSRKLLEIIYSVVPVRPKFAKP